MRFLKYGAMAVIMVAVVGAMVFLETQTDVIADARQAIGMPTDENREPVGDVAVNAPDNLVDRVVNWRAYSGQNRHLPPAPEGWTRVEVADLAPGDMDAFMHHIRPAHVAEEVLAEVNTANELEMTGQEAAIIERAGKVFSATSGFSTGGAVYRSGPERLVIALMRTPRRYGGVMSQMMRIQSMIDPATDTELRIGQHRLKVTRPDDDAYVTVEGQIGNLYTLRAQGNVTDDVLIAFFSSMDLDRLETEGVGADDPMDAIGPIGHLMMRPSKSGADRLRAQ